MRPDSTRIDSPLHGNPADGIRMEFEWNSEWNHQPILRHQSIIHTSTGRISPQIQIQPRNPFFLPTLTDCSANSLKRHVHPKTGGSEGAEKSKTNMLTRQRAHEPEQRWEQLARVFLPPRYLPSPRPHLVPTIYRRTSPHDALYDSDAS